MRSSLGSRLTPAEASRSARHGLPVAAAQRPAGARRPHAAGPGADREVPGPPLRPGAVATPTCRAGTSASGARSSEPFTLSWAEFRNLPVAEQTLDIHCVTRWSKLDTRWEGVAFTHIAEVAQPTPDARFVIFHAEGGYTSNVPLETAMRPECLLAWSYDGQPLEPEHGYPLRAIVPGHVLLEEREVAARHRVQRRGSARILGAQRLPQRRRSLEGAALLGVLTPGAVVHPLGARDQLGDASSALAADLAEVLVRVALADRPCHPSRRSPGRTPRRSGRAWSSRPCARLADAHVALVEGWRPGRRLRRSGIRRLLLLQLGPRCRGTRRAKQVAYPPPRMARRAPAPAQRRDRHRRPDHRRRA